MKRIWRPALYAIMLSCMVLMALALAPAKEVRAEGEVESIEFERADPYVLWIGYHICETSISYNTTLLHGDVLTVNRDSGSKAYVYSMEDECFTAEDGETISQDEVSVNMDDYCFDWALNGEANYYSVSYGGASCLVPVEVKESPVDAIEYHPMDRLEDYYNGSYRPYKTNDEVIVHYKDGTSETFLYDENMEYPFESAYHVQEGDWCYHCRSFVSQTDGHLIPSEHPFKIFESMFVEFDSDSRVYTINYMGAKAYADDNTFVMTGISYEQTEPLVLSRKMNASTVERDDGTTYEVYYFENQFAEGDTLHVRFETINHTEKTIDFVCNDWNVFYPTIEIDDSYFDYISGWGDVKIDFPDQSEEPLQPDTIYEFPVYITDAYDGHEANYYFVSDAGYQVQIIGNPDTVEDTRSPQPDFETWLQVLADAGFTDGYFSSADTTAEDIYRMVTAYYYYDKEPGYTVMLDYDDFRDAARKVMDGYYNVADWQFQESDHYDAKLDTVTLTVDPADPEIHFEMSEGADPNSGNVVVKRIDQSGNQQGMARLIYNTYDEFCLAEIKPFNAEFTIEDTRSPRPDFETWLQILADAGFADGYYDYSSATAEDIYRMVTAYYYYDKEPGYTVTLDYEDFSRAADEVIYYYSWEMNLKESDCYDPENDTVTLTYDPADAEVHLEEADCAYPNVVMLVNRIDRSGNQQGMALLSYSKYSAESEYYLRQLQPYEDGEYEVRWSYYLPYQYDFPHKEGLPKVVYENAWLFLEYTYYKNGEVFTGPYFNDYMPSEYSFHPEGVVGFDMGYGSGTPSMRGLKAGTTKFNMSFWFAWTRDIIMHGPENHPTYTMEEEIEVRPQTMKLDRDKMILAVGDSEVLGVSGLEEEDDSLMETSFNVGYRGYSDVISVDSTGKVTGLEPGVESYLSVISEKGQAQQIQAYVYDVQLSENEFTADGTRKEPTVVSVQGPTYNMIGSTAFSPEDWSVVGYENNIHAGTATVIIELRSTGIEDVITIRKSFTILPGATVPVTGISLNKTSLTLGMGLSETLTATVAPADASDQSVIWTSSDESIVKVDENGVLTAGMNFGTATVTAKTADGGFTASCEVDVRFRDVMDAKKYYYKPVYWAAEKGITKGYTTGEHAGNFGVGMDCQRKDLLIFLWRFVGQPTKDKTGKAYGDARTMFNDMSAYNTSSAANKAVAWAVKEGITKGYADGGFHPTAPIVRKDVMILLYRVAGKPAVSGTLKFTDCQNLNKNSDTYKAILWGSQKGITNGYSSGEYAGQFGTGLPCLREQIVTFLYRYNNLK